MIDKLLDEIFIRNTMELLLINKNTIKINGEIFDSHLKNFATFKQVLEADKKNRIKDYEEYQDPHGRSIL